MCASPYKTGTHVEANSVLPSRVSFAAAQCFHGLHRLCLFPNLRFSGQLGWLAQFQGVLRTAWAVSPRPWKAWAEHQLLTRPV
jgi:hypothetical protein